MSTEWLPTKPIDFEKIRSLENGEVYVDRNAMEKHGIKDEDRVVLTDGQNYLMAYKSWSGKTYFTRYGQNGVGKILGFLSEMFHVRWVSEHDEEVFGRFSAYYVDRTPVTSVGSEMVTIPGNAYGMSVGDGQELRKDLPCVDAQHELCSTIIQSMLSSGEVAGKLNAKEQDLLSYLISKLVLDCGMEYKKLTIEELRELKVLLNRIGGDELNAPLSERENQEVCYLTMIARSPDGVSTKERLTCDEWEYLGQLLARQREFEISVDGKWLNIGQSDCLSSLMRDICKALKNRSSGGSETENKVVSAIVEAGSAGDGA